MRGTRLISFGMFLLCLAAVPSFCGAAGAFTLTDPKGDDFGPGGFIYPKNRAFEPYFGLYDLLSFTVDSEPGTVHFELEFADLRNTWSAPEGFSHQLAQIYICRSRTGRTEPLSKGAYVRFTAEYPWDAMIRAVPWDSSEIILLGRDGQPEQHPVQVGVNGQRILIEVPTDLLGEPMPSWRYYVLVGSYDGFGEDTFRPVMEKPGEWCLGGGLDDNVEPNVIDLLAPARGRYSQANQLGSYDPEEGRLALLMPVGPDFLPGVGGFPWVLVIALTLALFIVGWWFWYAPEEMRAKMHGFVRKIVRFGSKEDAGV